MEPLVFYYNEHSSPPSNISNGQHTEWETLALIVFSCLRKAHKLQPKMKVSFPNNGWHAMYGAKPFSVWMKKWLGEQRYQWLLTILRNSTPLNSDDIDVYFDGDKAIGFTCSHLTNSWAVSFPVEESPWIQPFLSASEYYTDGDDIIERDCIIKNLAHDEHVDHWESLLIDWGREVADNNVVGNIEGLLIVMYPRDHGYPHIHLIDPQSYDSQNHRKTVAKYRIDHFERMEGHPQWDNQMRAWIRSRRGELLVCWARCQGGQHPYKIRE